MKNILLEEYELKDIELGEPVEEVVEKEKSETKLSSFLNFLFVQNSRITAAPRVAASALYFTSGIQYNSWLRSVGAGITLFASVLGLIINQKEDKPLQTENKKEYIVGMIKRSFDPINHIRQFAGPMLFLSSTCLGIGGVMSGRYTELLFTASGFALGFICMFTPKDIDANRYAARMRNFVMPFIFLVNGADAFIKGDSIAISSMVLNQVSSWFSGGINAWKKRQDSQDMSKNCFSRYC